MPNQEPKQVIQVGTYQVELPEGVSVDQWALEKVRWQNPRIRAFLGCMRLLEGVLESNYAILHCSPERLLDIWAKVRDVAGLIRTRLAPLLEEPSVIPRLEQARKSSAFALSMLETQVLEMLDRFPEQVGLERLPELRKLLCVSIGQLHDVLQDTFGEVMASDPRSLYDADYFLSRRFRTDVDEAEWLHGTVDRLRQYLADLEVVRAALLAEPAAIMRREEAVPAIPSWEPTSAFLEVLERGLAPKLKEVLALRAVRFYELELLDRYAVEIPTMCKLLEELHAAASAAIERMRASVGASEPERTQGVRDLLHCHAVWSARLAALLDNVDAALRDLVAFVPLWLEGIENRRALMLRRGGEEAGAP